jgi:Fic family protein
LNERQVKLLNKLLDGFEGKLTSSKWAAIAKCSPDTALRDINDLLHGVSCGNRMRAGAVPATS